MGKENVDSNKHPDTPKFFYRSIHCALSFFLGLRKQQEHAKQIWLNTNKQWDDSENRTRATIVCLTAICAVSVISFMNFNQPKKPLQEIKDIAEQIVKDRMETASDLRRIVNPNTIDVIGDQLDEPSVDNWSIIVHSLQTYIITQEDSYAMIALRNLGFDINEDNHNQWVQELQSIKFNNQELELHQVLTQLIESMNYESSVESNNVDEDALMLSNVEELTTVLNALEDQIELLHQRNETPILDVKEAVLLLVTIMIAVSGLQFIIATTHEMKKRLDRFFVKNIELIAEIENDAIIEQFIRPYLINGDGSRIQFPQELKFDNYFIFLLNQLEDRKRIEFIKSIGEINSSFVRVTNILLLEATYYKDKKIDWTPLLIIMKRNKDKNRIIHLINCYIFNAARTNSNTPSTDS